jgi:hypothetical protein
MKNLPESYANGSEAEKSRSLVSLLPQRVLEKRPFPFSADEDGNGGELLDPHNIIESLSSFRRIRSAEEPAKVGYSSTGERAVLGHVQYPDVDDAGIPRLSGDPDFPLVFLERLEGVDVEDVENVLKVLASRKLKLLKLKEVQPILEQEMSHRIKTAQAAALDENEDYVEANVVDVEGGEVLQGLYDATEPTGFVGVRERIVPTFRELFGIRLDDFERQEARYPLTLHKESRILDRFYEKLPLNQREVTVYFDEDQEDRAYVFPLPTTKVSKTSTRGFGLAYERFKEERLREAKHLDPSLLPEMVILDEEQAALAVHLKKIEFEELKDKYGERFVQEQMKHFLWAVNGMYETVDEMAQENYEKQQGRELRQKVAAGKTVVTGVEQAEEKIPSKFKEKRKRTRRRIKEGRSRSDRFKGFVRDVRDGHWGSSVSSILGGAIAFQRQLSISQRIDSIENPAEVEGMGIENRFSEMLEPLERVARPDEIGIRALQSLVFLAYISHEHRQKSWTSKLIEENEFQGIQALILRGGQSVVNGVRGYSVMLWPQIMSRVLASGDVVESLKSLPFGFKAAAFIGTLSLIKPVAIDYGPRAVKWAIEEGPDVLNKAEDGIVNTVEWFQDKRGS